jgi:hypothetical protein
MSLIGSMEVGRVASLPATWKEKLRAGGIHTLTVSRLHQRWQRAVRWRRNDRREERSVAGGCRPGCGSLLECSGLSAEMHWVMADSLDDLWRFCCLLLLVQHLLSHSDIDLMELVDLHMHEVHCLLQLVGAHCTPPPATAWARLEEVNKQTFLMDRNAPSTLISRGITEVSRTQRHRFTSARSCQRCAIYVLLVRGGPSIATKGCSTEEEATNALHVVCTHVPRLSSAR